MFMFPVIEARGQKSCAQVHDGRWQQREFVYTATAH